MTRWKTWLSLFLLCMPVLLTTSCVHHSTQTATKTPRFFVAAIEDYAVRHLRATNATTLSEPFGEDANAELERMRGWRVRADEAWLGLRQRVDDVCTKLDYGPLSDKEAWEAVVCVRSIDELASAILFGDVEMFLNGHAHPVAVLMGVTIVLADRERRKAVREVG